MKHALSEQLVILAELTILPDKLDAFLDYTVANLPVSRGYPGNLRFDMLVDDEHPHIVRFHEEWTSDAAQQAYMAWRVGEGDLERLMSFLSAPPSFARCRTIAA